MLALMTSLVFEINADHYILPFVSMDTYMHPEDVFYVTAIVQPRMEIKVC